jgi:hypothetical protein
VLRLCCEDVVCNNTCDRLQRKRDMYQASLVLQHAGRKSIYWKLGTNFVRFSQPDNNTRASQRLCACVLENFLVVSIAQKGPQRIETVQNRAPVLCVSAIQHDQCDDCPIAAFAAFLRQTYFAIVSSIAMRSISLSHCPATLGTSAREKFMKILRNILPCRALESVRRRQARAECCTC